MMQTTLSLNERVWLEAVARGSAHGLGRQERDRTLQSLRERGLVENAFVSCDDFQVVRVTQSGYRALAAYGLAPDWRNGLEGLVSSLFEDREDPVRILHIGAGNRCNFMFPDHKVRLTVCDMDAAAAAAADEQRPGDVAVPDFTDQEFDLIVFWDVLERLAEPLRTLTSTLRSLAHGGAAFIKGPVVSSLPGMLAKYTPHFLHVAYYRHVLGVADAGRPGYGPYRTRFTPEADDRAIAEALRSLGLEIFAERRYVGPHVDSLKEKSRYAYAAFRNLSDTIESWTDYSAGGLKSDFFIIARRPRPLAGPTGAQASPPPMAAAAGLTAHDIGDAS
jgi:hypothetical protein